MLAVSDSVCGIGDRKRSLDSIYLCLYTNLCVPGLLFHMLQLSPFDAHYLNKKYYNMVSSFMLTSHCVTSTFFPSFSYINKGLLCSFLFIKVPNQK